jgi:ubiquinone/menaquinone biosynthesis C-methylase UbiE
MAAKYDMEDRVKIAKIIVQAVRSQIEETIAHSREKAALDYGCGTGLIGLGLTDLFASMLFVDASEPMLEQINRKIDAAGVSGAGTLCCDFTQVVPPGLRVDCVIMSQVLLHIRDSRSILDRLHGMLNEDGHLIIVDFDKNAAITSELVHNGFDQVELTALLKDIGFTTVSAHTFYHGKAMFMKEDASLFVMNAH